MQTVAAMKLQATRVDTLPRLAWCVHMRRHADDIQLWHGPWVEARDGWFCEGAWDGDFAQGGMAEAYTLFGSGGRVTADGVLFATPTHILESMYSLQVDGDLWVSNSLVFLLVQAGDEPDPNHARYFFDILRHYRKGIRVKTKTLPTRKGRRVFIHDCCNLLVRPELTLSRQEKRVPPAPSSYEGYVQMLQRSMEALVANAGHPHRVQRFRPVASISRGYDSVAAAVLAAQAGCVEAVTIAGEQEGDPPGGDDGTIIAEMLGMKATRYWRLAYRQLGGFPEAEFRASPPGGGMPRASMAPQLAGALLFGGETGDWVWSLSPNVHTPDLQRPGAVVGPVTPTEFRLRAGYIDASVPVIGAAGKNAIHRITTSAEMQPWAAPRSYQRPIARRIAEEAGIPRELFGQRKMATIHQHVYTVEDLIPASREDFLAFCAERAMVMRRPGPLRRLLYKALGWVGVLIYTTIRRLPYWLWLRLIALTWLPLRDYRHPMWWSPTLFTFHWGFERIKGRYHVDQPEPQ